MHLSDLIPDRESLLTRDYWWTRSQLGLGAREFEPVAGFSTMRQPAESHVETLARPHNVDPNDTSTPQVNAAHKAGGAPLAEAASVGLNAPQLRTAVRNLAPEINWDYAVIERLDAQSLQTRLLPFDLGKLVREHDSSQDLELEAGDVVTIFSSADLRIPIAHQTRTVTLEGEFAHPGSYTAAPGETLRALVARVGGLSPNAYLYGSAFTRKSARAVQQTRIDEYIQTLSMKIQRVGMALSAAQSGHIDETSNAGSVQQSVPQLIAALRQIQATGQIVLEMEPGAKTIDCLPEMALEDGDRLVVPPMPSSVNVVGSVYNQNSYIYMSERRAKDYLRLSGGPTRDADKSHTIIIRANGSVVSRDNGGGFLNVEFGKLQMYPGDTIVVPEKTFRISSLRSYIEWSQTFSQLAMGAATLSLLR
jgi:protein involved in polysaccharide export with SLBB domain